MIGIGIITCNRPHYLLPLVTGLLNVGMVDRSLFDSLVVINDGEALPREGWNSPWDWVPYFELKNEKNLGSGGSKNRAMQYLLDKGCDDIFLIEDDMVILDYNVFSKYIEASKVSGIKHFNYGPGSPFNRRQTIHRELNTRHLLDPKSEPLPRMVVDYGQVKIDLYEHTVAMFSYFKREVLEKVGLIDTDHFRSAFDHVEHTYRIIKAGFHPPFWYFADIHDSCKYLQEAEGAIENSVIAKDEEKWMKEVMEARETYLSLHGHYPNNPPPVTEEDVFASLRRLSKET